mgnify:CR=1 FL=1
MSDRPHILYICTDQQSGQAMSCAGNRDLATPAQRAGMFASMMLPILVGIVAAQGGMFIAIDVTAAFDTPGVADHEQITRLGEGTAIKIADIAAIYDVSCMMGCMLETSIGVSAAAHLAVAKSGSITRVDLDAPSLGTINPVSGGVRFEGPEISITDAPGLGIDNISELSMLRFDKAAVS